MKPGERGPELQMLKDRVEARRSGEAGCSGDKLRERQTREKPCRGGGREGGNAQMGTEDLGPIWKGVSKRYIFICLTYL